MNKNTSVSYPIRCYRLFFDNSPPELFDGSVFESFRSKDIFFPDLSDRPRQQCLCGKQYRYLYNDLTHITNLLYFYRLRK